MKPYYEHAGITIYHGDCREVLGSFPKCFSVDALVVDPPYGIGWSRGTWNDDPKAYPALMRWLVKTSNRIVPDGYVFVFQAMPNCGKWHKWFPPGFRLFAACKNFAQVRPTGLWHAWDPVVFWKNGPNSGPNSEVVNRDFHVGNVAGVFGEKSAHPCPRPLDTMTHIVACAARAGGTVLDPFMGSGTTLVAAKNLGRKAIGIEIEERYCEIAAKRLAQEILL